MVPADDVARAVAMVNGANTDLLVLGGDYVTWGERAYVGPVAELLEPLTAPHGVFAILGNHDDDRDMPAALARNGFTVLKDQRTRSLIRGEPLEHRRRAILDTQGGRCRPCPAPARSIRCSCWRTTRGGSRRRPC